MSDFTTAIRSEVGELLKQQKVSVEESVHRVFVDQWLGESK